MSLSCRVLMWWQVPSTESGKLHVWVQQLKYQKKKKKFGARLYTNHLSPTGLAQRNLGP